MAVKLQVLRPAGFARREGFLYLYRFPDKGEGESVEAVTVKLVVTGEGTLVSNEGVAQPGAEAIGPTGELCRGRIVYFGQSGERGYADANTVGEFQGLFFFVPQKAGLDEKRAFAEACRQWLTNQPLPV